MDGGARTEEAEGASQRLMIVAADLFNWLDGW